ncbi:MAG: SGNH/GDSL hydrolase family protein [Acidobacteriota bacterium]
MNSLEVSRPVGTTERAGRGTPLLRALVVVVGLVAALLLAEVGLRLAGFSFHVYPEKVQFGWPKSIGGAADPYVRDADLLWVPRDWRERLARAREEPPRMIFLGDSCTEFGAYPSELNRLLVRSGSRHLTSMKFGVAGWTTYQGLHALERDLLPLRPALVTVDFGWNDHWKGYGIEDRDIGGLPFMRSALEPLRLVQLVQKATIALRGRSYAAQRVALADFRANLRQIARQTRAAGAVPVLLTAPTSNVEGQEPSYLRDGWLDDISQLLPLHRRYAQAVREVAASEHVPLCDLLEDFDRLPEEQRRASFGSDGIHFTNPGSARAGEMLYRCFAAHPEVRVALGG